MREREMLAGEVDWASLLVHSLDKSPLVLHNTFNKTVQRSNSWQCHILACMFTCLIPRVRAEMADFRTCSSHSELEQKSCAFVQAASQKVVHALQQAESFIQACHHEDAASLIVSTACTGEALTVHVHNLFWSVSGLILATRVSLGFPDDKLSMYIEQQVNCWSESISRYIGLSAELLDLKDLASMVDAEIISGVNGNIEKRNLFENACIETPTVAHVLSHRLKWVLCKDHTRESQIDSLLVDLKIDYKDLVFENRSAMDEENREKREYARASWAGIPVAIKRCRASALRESTAMLLRIRNPFILQLIGWAEAPDDKGLSCCMVMEDVHTDLESFIKARTESKAAQDKEGGGLLFPFSEALDMMLQIARGMWYLHRNKIAHKGLRSRKVWLRTEDDSDAKWMKLCHVGLPSFMQMSNSSDYAADVLSFGMLCGEILTGKEMSTNGAGVLEMQLPSSTPILLSDCLKACGDVSPQNRPEFGVICGLLRHLKLIVANPHHLERLLYFNEAAKASSKPPITESASPLIKGTSKAAPDSMAIRIELIDINVHLLRASTPPDLYPLAASESWLARPPVSLRMLEDMSIQLTQGLQSRAQGGTLISSSSSTTMQLKFVISNASTLKTSLVVDGWQGLLKSGWANTTLGVGTLEMWLQHLSPKWKDVQKVALGVALCLRHVSKTPPKFGFYSHEQGNIDGFYPIYPGNILLSSQLKVILLLDNSLIAWKGLIQWAGIHPQVGEGVDNILISIEAYTTFYFGHLLASIIKARRSKVVGRPTATSSLDQHYEFVLTNLSMRCIQLKYLCMTEVVTILLNDYKPYPNPKPSASIE